MLYRYRSQLTSPHFFTRFSIAFKSFTSFSYLIEATTSMCLLCRFPEITIIGSRINCRKPDDINSTRESVDGTANGTKTSTQQKKKKYIVPTYFAIVSARVSSLERLSACSWLACLTTTFLGLPDHELSAGRCNHILIGGVEYPCNQSLRSLFQVK